MLHIRITCGALGVAWVCGMPGWSQELAITGTSPAIHSLAVPAEQGWSIEFDRPIEPGMLTSGVIRTFGRNRGVINGSMTLANGGRTLQFAPTEPLAAGELVTVLLPSRFAAEDGALIGRTGYALQYTVASAAVESLSFQWADSETTNDVASSRPYGGVATDLDRDGWIDLAIVNEDTSDVRVFMNDAQGTGNFAPFLQPTFGVGNQASPSEVADFNADGLTDMVVASPASGTISILLGQGDGTFASQREISLGGQPRGVGVIDMDGDGDVDIVNANPGRGGVSFLTNDGFGYFTETNFMDGGVDGEWPLAVADMNNDGTMDIVVGGVLDNQVNVLTGNGDGTYSRQASKSLGGAPWQITVGDVNQDGRLDVSSANSWSHSGAILLGNGDGTLQTADVYDIGSMGTGSNLAVTATDLGDLDGDGDLDWVTSSFMGNWVVLLNDGTGHFDFFRQIDAPGGASCSLLFDVDNDGDLDIAGVDEIADVLVVLTNEGQSKLWSDLNGDRAVDALDAGVLFSQWGTSGEGDLNGDGVIDAADAGQLFAAWTGDVPVSTVPEPLCPILIGALFLARAAVQGPKFKVPDSR